MFRKVALSFGLTLTLLTAAAPSVAVAAAPACADVFVGKSAFRQALSTMAQRARDTSGLSAVTAELKDLVQQVRASRFKIQNYEEALALYRSQETAAWQKPANREAKLALLQVFNERSGTDALKIENVVHAYSQNHSNLRRLANSVGRIDPTKGFSGVQLDEIWLKIYGYQFVSPLNSAKVKDLGVSGVERELLRQWSDRILAKHSLPEAAERLGLYRTPNAKEKFAQWYQGRSKKIDFAVKGVLNLLSFYSRGFIQSRTYSAFDHQKMSAELVEILKTKGFDATYPVLKKHYGHLAKFDRQFYLVKKYFLRTATAAMLVYFYPATVQAVIGADRYDIEGRSYVQITEDLAVHTARVAQNFYLVKVKGDDGVIRTVKLKTVLDPNDPYRLNDGAGPSNDPNPVRVSDYQKANGGTDLHRAQVDQTHKANTKKALEKTAGFERQFEDASKILNTGVGQEQATSEEAEQYNRDLDTVDFSEFEPKD